MSEDKKKVPRTWASKGFLIEVENGTYGLFRSILVETDEVDEKTGEKKREKTGDPIGPLALFRRANSNEQPDLITNYPGCPDPLFLKAIPLD